MCLLTMICLWEYHPLSVLYGASHPTRLNRVSRMEYNAKQRYAIYTYTIVCVYYSSWKCPVHRGTTYSKCVNHDVNNLSFPEVFSLLEIRGGHCGALRVLKSYCMFEWPTYKLCKLIIIVPFHKAIRRNIHIHWITKPVHKHRYVGCHLWTKGVVVLERATSLTTLLVALHLQHGEDFSCSLSLSLLDIMFIKFILNKKFKKRKWLIKWLHTCHFSVSYILGPNYNSSYIAVCLPLVWNALHLLSAESEQNKVLPEPRPLPFSLSTTVE